MRRHKAPDDEGFQRFEQFLEEWSRRDFMKRTGGAAALAAFMVGVPEFLAACGPSQAQPGPAGSPVKGGHIVEASASDPTTFNSVFVQDNVSEIIHGLMFDALLIEKANGELIPAIASSVPNSSSDGLSYTFNLRKDVKWSDGQQLTAEDVVFTYQLMYDPAYKAVRSRQRPELEQYIDFVKAIDPFTVVIKTKTVFAPFLDSFCTPHFGILPKHVLEKLKPDEINNADFNTAPTVVSGAFKFVKWEKGAQVTLARNENYYRGPANLEQYVYRVVSDSVAVTNQLKTGEIDVGVIDPSLWDDMGTASNINRVSFVSPSWEYYGYQLDETKRPAGKIFKDKAVRQALYYALDRQKIADRVYFKQAVPADSPQPLTSWAHNPNVKRKYPFDRKKAEEMLDEAGWIKGPDGIRQKDGQKMSFELITNVGNKTREALIVVMKEQWRQVGADAVTKPIQFTEYLKTAQTRLIDTYVGGIFSGVDPDQAQIFHSRVIGKGLNRMGYSNPEVDKLLDDAVTTLDRSKRKDMYYKIQDILSEDVPMGILVYQKSNWGVSKRVQNFNLGPFNRYGARPWMKDVFVTDGK